MFVATLNIFLWKHWKNMRSRWFSLLCNFAVPIVLPILLILFIHSMSSIFRGGERLREPTIYDSFTPRYGEDTIYYAPDSTFNAMLMKKVQKTMPLQGNVSLKVVPFVSESALNEFIRNNLTVFDSELCVLFADDVTSPSHLRYTILAVSDNFHTNDRLANDYLNRRLRFQNEYDASGFLAVQQAIDAALAESWGATADRPAPKIKVELQEMPTNATNLFDVNTEGIMSFMGFMWFLYTFTLINMVLVPTVEEKESGIKEFLRIASSYSSLNMVTYFFVNVLMGFLMFLIVLATAWFFEFTAHFYMIYMLILVVLYIMSSVAFTFMLSVMFKTVFFAKNAGFLFYVGQFAVQLFPQVSFLTPALNNVLFMDAIETIDQSTLRYQVLDWEGLFYAFSEHDSIFATYLYLIMDTAIYLTLYIYFIQVFPGTFGTPKPFWFPFQPSTYFQIKQVLKKSEHSLTKDDNEVVVKIRGLTKEFSECCGKSIVAVNNLDLDIHKNQITVLLGHNGAGKTTTMSIISGIIPKTSGTISVDGEDNVDAYRHKIGYCPQHNVFLPYFTCSDHLQFFGCLRGLSKRDARNESMKLLDKLHMKHKAHEYGEKLSGGMKRRLCLGNAIIGNTQIAILDEPSSGLDPESRRELWDVLLELRKNHTILITTHYMEEAEMLADYISIMSRGEIICDGTAINLKRQYAHGYVMKLLTTEGFSVDRLMGMVQRHIPSAAVNSFIRPTIHITLPYKYMDQYPAMLKEVEDQMQEIGISTISMTDASLEDVFLNCDPKKHAPDQSDTSEPEDPLIGTNIPQTSINLMWHQILAILYKKNIFIRRHIVFFLVAIGILFVCTGLAFIPINGQSDDDPQETSHSSSITISARSIRNTEVLLNVQNRIQPNIVAFETNLRTYLREQDVRIRDWEFGYNVSELLEFEQNDIRNYHEQILCAIRVKFDENNVVVRALYSKNWWHSSVIVQNLIDNVVARLYNETGKALEIVTVNEPISSTKGYARYSAKGSFGLYKLILPFGLFAYMLFYVYLPFGDEICEFKKLLPISPVLYWMTTFLFDMLLHLLVCLMLILFHIPLDREHYFGCKELATLFSVYLVYGVVTLPFLYISAQIFSSLSSLYSYLTYSSLVPFVCALILSANPITILRFSNWIRWLMLIPNYSLEHAVSVFLIEFRNEHDTSIANGLRLYFIYMIGVAVVLMVFLIFVMENLYCRDAILRMMQCCKRRILCRKPPVQMPSVTETPDVIREREHTELVAHSNLIQNYAICVRQLCKQFELFEAVRNVSFTVARGECFGLLGMNGAGKTTTFKMMTRDLTITTGNIYFNGLDSKANPATYNQMFGYCPQVDALNTFMTAYETVKFMAMVRGTPFRQIDHSVCKLLRNTDLNSYKDVMVKNFSGGTKRKLNTALAMQSDPRLVFLDEPTTGVDPSSRRFIWSCIQNCQKQNKNIVLTSHSMDECEFLCNRLAIMNHGRLNCIGPVLELKKTFDLGFLITIVVDPAQTTIEEVRSAIRGHFDCVLREEYGNQLCYLVSDKDLRWSDVFKRLQAVKQQYEHVVSDFSITESSLEDIFLKISRQSNLASHQSV